MSEGLISVGVDVGTTTTQLVVSRLEIENQAGAFAVPEMVIRSREILYESPVYFTPLLGHNLVDGEGIRTIVAAEYEKAGLRREDVDTGAIIITGETSRKENARAVLEAIAEYAGDFVVATAGPDLESVLAAKGAGAVALSAQIGGRVLHMDIGGGTSNLALIEDGKIVRTGCLNVGGRLLKFDRNGVIFYVSPVLDGICNLKVGDRVNREAVENVANLLVQALEMAAGLREKTALFGKLWTKEVDKNAIARSEATWQSPDTSGNHRGFPRQSADWLGMTMISFSGGVADCIEKEQDWLAFGDMGPVLGRAIRESRLCRGPYRLGEQTIRATVIGAGCHSAQLSGSTVFHQNVTFPLKNRPVVAVSEQEQERPEILRRKLQQCDADGVIALPGFAAPGYGRVVELARAVVDAFGERPVLVAVQKDMAKALGQAMALRLPKDRPCLCIDRVRLEEGSYLDVAAPIGPALPVVVKTLVLAN